jgi:hypothetical protein
MTMKVPAEYATWVSGLGFTELSFGYGGVKIFTFAELEESQVGYSRSPSGESFCDGQPGSWRPEWVVIGYETSLGDPIILDTAAADLQVKTALHGEGSWDPFPIARSLNSFGEALKAVQAASVDREYPVALENNPLPEEQGRAILESIRKANGDQINMEFWELLLEIGLDG